MKIPSSRDHEIHREICSRGSSITYVAERLCISKSAVRAALDRVTEFDGVPITLTLDGSEWAEVIGWLRNGNVKSGDLADRIAELIRVVEK
jgi:hypothetical protein